jgi:hypothetical protein
MRRAVREQLDAGALDLEAEAPVEADVRLRGGLEIAVAPLCVDPPEPLPKQRRAHSEPLKLGVDADHLQVPASPAPTASRSAVPMNVRSLCARVSGRSKIVL